MIAADIAIMIMFNEKPENNEMRFKTRKRAERAITRVRAHPFPPKRPHASMNPIMATIMKIMATTPPNANIKFMYGISDNPGIKSDPFPEPKMPARAIKERPPRTNMAPATMYRMAMRVTPTGRFMSFKSKMRHKYLS